MTEKCCGTCVDELARLQRVAWGVVHNVRHRNGQPLWPMVMKATGLGSNSAASLCREYGRDPNTGEKIDQPKDEQT